MHRCAKLLVAVLIAGARLASAGPLPALVPEIAAAVAKLDCSQLGADDVAQVLSRVPAPRVIALHGSVPVVTMEPFADFLEAMGYPAERLVNPADGRRTRSSFVDSRRLAGHLAWHYEQDGMMPVLIGHSQGGMVVIKLLHDMAGTRSDLAIPVWDPHRDAPETRTWVVEPASGAQRQVRDLKVDYAAVLATGSLPRLLLGQWGILPLLRDVPDAVADLTGFAIPWDAIAGTGPRPAPFHATGTARVRNVVLPAHYSHVDLPRTAHLAAQPAVRAWIETYHPGSRPPSAPGSPAPDVEEAERPSPGPELREADITNLLHAADIWYSLKRNWCEAGKRLAGPPHNATAR